MNEAEAYAEAERRIEVAWQSGVTSLSLSNKKNRALEVVPDSIAVLTGLTELSLMGTSVIDLSPLSGLTSLTELWLDGTSVTDLSPLAGLADLTLLSVNDVSVTDLSPLSGLTSLTELWLISTAVTDLSPLAGLTGLTRLSLAKTPVTDLSPLAGLTSLTTLWLYGARVTDLSPLSGLTGLTRLSLDKNPVIDLRPIRKLAKLVVAPDPPGLTFTECRAAQIDPEIAEIAGIRNNSTRARRLFDYLKDWEPPADSGIEPDPLIQMTIDDDRLEIVAKTPGEAEVEERLKQLLYQQLREYAADLARAGGNRYPILATRARALQQQLQPEFAQTDLLMLHLAVEDLRSLHDLGAEEEGDPFPAEVTIPLRDVVDRGPGLTLGNPEVDTLLERANRRRAADPEPEAVQQTQNDMSGVVAGHPDAFGDRLRALEDVVQESPSAEAQVVQRAVNRNVLWVIAAKVLSDARSAFVGAVITPVLGPSIASFAQTNWPILVEVAATYGPGFKIWFVNAMSHAPEMTRIIEDYRKIRDR